MTFTEAGLESRLGALPDVYPGFVRASLHSIKQCGLEEEIVDLLDENPDATTETVLIYESLRCGLVDRYSEDGERMPVPCEWLALTSGMRSILAEMRGKTLKSYQLALAGDGGALADRSVRLNLGQHAVDLSCCGFAFDVGGAPVELGAMRCERMSLRDDFGYDPDAPVRAYAVGERITGVELVTEHAEVLRGGDATVLDVDAAVAVRTSRGVYTFARESWASTGIRASASGSAEMPYGEDELRAQLQALLGGAAVGGVSRTAERLA